ncbi:MAG TPA: FHA domain-containing protein [Candidatus Nanopelagicaceae bacterium]|nr:FHA domain-containing protein [Candidatus Nanopelagicaceae bacterium]
MINCWSCGQLVSDPNVCQKCGADLNSQTGVINLNSLRATPTPIPHDRTSLDDFLEANVQAVAELPENCALLVVERGPQAGSRFLLDSDLVTVGRASENEIFLDDISVSRKHAKFERSLGADEAVHFKVLDVGSLNGTYVNRERIDSIELTSGDEVQIGKFRLIFYPGVPQ